MRRVFKEVDLCSSAVSQLLGLNTKNICVWKLWLYVARNASVVMFHHSFAIDTENVAYGRYML